MMIMKKCYSIDFEKEECASARLEGSDVSYKDLSQVCGRIRKKTITWSLEFLKDVAAGSIPVLYKSHNKRLGHRHELGGKKGRYPKKAARIVLEVLRSAISNAIIKGLGDELYICHCSANKKASYPRLASKGRRARADYELSRIEIVLAKNLKMNDRKGKK